MFTGSGFLNLDAEQAPSVLVEVSDCLKRGFFRLFDVMIVLFNQALDESACLLKKLCVSGFISSLRSERSDGNVNDRAILTWSFSSERIPLHFNFFSAIYPLKLSFYFMLIFTLFHVHHK